MTSFAKSGFSYAGYAAFRPSYPPALFRTVLGFHNGHRTGSLNKTSSPSPSGTLLDIGCGHGLISRELAPHFAAVTAIDPSAGMVAKARELTTDPKISVRQAGAEDLSFLADRSVDMAVAGQAAHWFDYKRAWPELARVVKSGGTLAFWGYKDNILVGYPQIIPIYFRFVYGGGEVAPGIEGLERFWENPGRSILRDSLQAVVPPEADWADVKRIVWDPDRETGSIEDAPVEALWQRKTLKLGEFEGYLRTFSSFNNWRAEYPEKKSRAEGGDGDLVDVMFDRFLDAVPEWKALGDKWREFEVDSVWGTVILMARRR